MRKPITLLALLFAAATSFGQIVLTDAYFPAAGDTLTYGVASGDPGIDLLSAGADRQWDFSNQVAADTQMQVVLPYDGNEAFPEAEVIVAIDNNNAGYYSVSDNVYELVGIQGSLPEVLPGFVFDAPVSPGRAERRAPLAYLDRFESNTANVIAIDSDSLPAEAKEALREFGDVLNAFDSIRISSISERTDLVDAYGTLTINGQRYPVLREKRTETTRGKVEVKLGILGFQDVTAVILAQAPELQDFLGTQEGRESYYFWTDTEKEAVAIVTTDGDGNADGLRFALGDRLNSTGAPQLTQARVKVYPNPARGNTTFEVSGLDRGAYTLRIINVLGRQVSEVRFTPVGTTAKLPIDVSRLPRGTYLYSLTNERGLILTTRRLLVGH